MAGLERREVDADDFPVFHQPAAADHHPVGAMGSAEHKARQRILAGREARLVQLEQREIGLPNRRAACERAGRLRVGRDSAPANSAIRLIRSSLPTKR